VYKLMILLAAMSLLSITYGILPTSAQTKKAPPLKKTAKASTPKKAAKTMYVCTMCMTKRDKPGNCPKCVMKMDHTKMDHSGMNHTKASGKNP
jgi:uncharacterized protein involved in copper resistance